ncbi:MAG: DUF4105 domain-containing protein [Myxococcota bacterium]
MLTALTLVAALTTGQLPPWMTGQSQSADLAISLVTFGPGDTLTEWWGHTALVVEDKRLNHARLYNFGMFSFSEGFVHRFVQGRLEFWVADDPVPGTFNLYRSLNRDVRIQELDLTPEQAMAVAKALGTHVLPENRTYLYHHYDDNCSTRPRDILDAAIGGQLKAATNVPARMSLRAHTMRYSMVNPPMSLVLDYLQNDELDGPITQQKEAYLPDELERQVQALQVTGPDGVKHPLVKRQWTWFTAKRAPVPETPPNWIPWLFLLGLGVAGVGHALGWAARNGRKLPRVALGLLHVLLGLGLGAFGVFLFIVGIFTNHTVAHRNENLFLVNPITFALLPLGVMLMWGAKRARPGLFWTWAALGALSLLGVALKVLPMFDQQNWNLIALFVPVNVGFAALFWLDWRLREDAPASGGQASKDDGKANAPAT